MAKKEKPADQEDVQIDRQKILKSPSKAGSVGEKKAGKPAKPGEPIEQKPPEPPKVGLGERLWNARGVFATLVLFSVGTVWLGIGISEKETLGSVLGGVFLLLGFLAAVSTFVRKSA